MTFQESPLNSITFQACANPGVVGETVKTLMKCSTMQPFIGVFMDYSSSLFGNSMTHWCVQWTILGSPYLDLCMILGWGDIFSKPLWLSSQSMPVLCSIKLLTPKPLASEKAATSYTNIYNSSILFYNIQYIHKSVLDIKPCPSESSANMFLHYLADMDPLSHPCSICNFKISWPDSF